MLSNGSGTILKGASEKSVLRDILIDVVANVLFVALTTVIAFWVNPEYIRRLLGTPIFWIVIGALVILLGTVFQLFRKFANLKNQLNVSKDVIQLKDKQLGTLHDEIKTKELQYNALSKEIQSKDEQLHARQQEIETKDEQHNVLLNEFKKFLANSNIQQIYKNRLECNQVIQEKIKISSTIKLFLLIGSDFAEDSGIYQQALREKLAFNANIQILISSSDSPFLSEKRINKIREDKEDSRKQMHKMLDAVEASLILLKKEMDRKGIVVDWRKHKETFLCKFHLFDDCAIFCFNITTSNNDKVSPYFVIKKSEKSIYNALNMYFDFVWNNSIES